MSLLPPYTPPSPTLPRYSSLFSTLHPQRVKHVFQHPLKVSEYMSLMLLSRAKEPSHAPHFFQGDAVQGVLALGLNGSESIEAINITVRGRIITSAGDDGSFTFLDHVITIWTREMGDPRTAGRAGSNQRFAGKFPPGDYTWPIRFPFPSNVALSSDGNALWSLPETFVKKGIDISVRYDLFAIVARGRLRSDYKIQTPVSYTPSILPPAAFSALRLAAYRNRRLKALPGPSQDSSGWTTFSPISVSISSNLIRNNNASLDCTLSLSNPLSYVRGTVIPCYLSYEFTTSDVNDTRILDIFATPKASHVRLMQKITYYEHIACVRGKVLELMDDSDASKHLKSRIKRRQVVEDIAVAVWWDTDATDEIENQSRIRRDLQGEIHLSKWLQPSSSDTEQYGLFDVEYLVTVFPPDTHDFPSHVRESPSKSDFQDCASERSHIGALFQVPVQIVTTHAPRQISRALTPRTRQMRPPSRGLNHS